MDKADTITVATIDEFKEALDMAQGGQTILLRGRANYGPLNLHKPTKPFSRVVTIRSENPADRATFDWINLKDVQNLTIESVNIVTESRFAAITITGSTNITLRDSRVTANHDPHVAEQTVRRGVDLRDSVNIRFEDNVFQRLGSAFGVIQSSQVHIEGNLFQENLKDNLNLGSNVSDVIVSGNVFYSQLAKLFPDHHYDNIQLWVQTDANQNSRNITITGNTIYEFSGAVNAQAIFGRGDYADADGVENPYGFENLEISHNVIVTKHANAIAITDAKCLRIHHNTLVYGGVPGTNLPQMYVPGINVTKSSDYVISNNILPRRFGYPASDTDLFRDNTVYDVATGEIASMLLNPLRPNPTRNDFATLKVEAVRNAYGSYRGAEQLKPDNERPTALFQYQKEIRHGRFVYQLDASASLPVAGSDMQLAQYRWDFSDGTRGDKSVVEKAFDQAGMQQINLTVTDKDGNSNTLSKNVIVRDTKILSMEFNGDLLDASSYPSDLVATGEPIYVENDLGGKAVQLGGSLGHLYLPWTDPDYSEISQTRQLAINARLKVTFPNNGKPILVFASHRAWSLAIRKNSTAQFAVAGKFYTAKYRTKIDDGGWHEIMLELSDDAFTLTIDGEEVRLAIPNRSEANAVFQRGEYGLSIGGSGSWKSKTDSMKECSLVLDQLNAESISH